MYTWQSFDSVHAHLHHQPSLYSCDQIENAPSSQQMDFNFWNFPTNWNTHLYYAHEI